MYISTPVLSSRCFKAWFLVAGPLASRAVTSAEVRFPWGSIASASNRVQRNGLFIRLSGKALKKFQGGVGKDH